MPEPFDLSKLDAWKTADRTRRTWRLVIRPDHRPEVFLKWEDSNGETRTLLIDRPTLAMAIADALAYHRDLSQ